MGRLLLLLRRFITLLLRLAFNSLSYPLAPFYDKISYAAFLGQWPRWQRSVIPRIQGKRVLEVGCGTGKLLTEILSRGFKAYGVDLSAPMLSQARKKLVKAGFKGRLLRAKVETLPFPADSFETVISVFPTEYIAKVATLKEIQRVLYPGGRLVILDAARLKPFNLKAKILIWIYRFLLGYYGNRGLQAVRLPLAEAGLIRRDETFEDEQGEAHLIIAIKAW